VESPQERSVAGELNLCNASNAGLSAPSRRAGRASLFGGDR
jgi:hypothetical protein